MKVINLSYAELIAFNGGHNGAAYRAGKKVGDKLQEAWECITEFAEGFWDGIRYK